MTTTPGPNVLLVLVDNDLRSHVVVHALGGSTDSGSFLRRLSHHSLPPSRGLGPSR